MPELKCVERAKCLVDHRFELAKKAKDEGRTVVGHYCCLAASELITAAGAYPFRIQGDVHEAPTEVDRVLEPTMCPFLRSTVDLALKGKYDFLDVLIVPHACECMEKMFDIWETYIESLEHVFVQDIPHMVYPESYTFYAKALRSLAAYVEKETGLVVTEKKLREAIALHNENRRLMQEIYAFRKSDSPVVSAVETFYLVHAGDVVDANEFNALLKDAVAELRAVVPEKRERRPRIMVHAAELDDPELLELIDQCGGEVVCDDMCIGSRAVNFQVRESGDPYLALATAYLRDIHCPRTCRVDLVDHEYDHLVHMANEYRVDGMLLYVTRYCDTYAYDAPILRRVMENDGVSVLHLEEDYNIESSKGQIKTRIQAFVEML